MSKRLSRKQIKEDIRHDEVQTALTSTYDQIMEHRNLVIGVVIAVIVAGIGFSAMRAYMARRDQAAAVELAQALKVYAAPIDEEAAKPDDPSQPSFANEDDWRTRTREAMEAVEGGMAASVATLFLADLALEEGDKATARKYWEDFVENHESHILTVSVRLNLIRLDREEGKAEELAQELRAELESEERSLPEDLILYELAETLDTLERGEEAQEYFQRILDDHPQSPYSAKARQKISS